MDEKNEEIIKYEKYRERLARWQGRMIDQLGFVNNLFIILATGVLAFQTDFIFRQDLKSDKLYFVLSIFIMLSSLVSGCYVAVNRLRDFSISKTIVRSRMNGEDKDKIEELRTQSKEFGKKTWVFLKYQVISWLLSIFVLVIVSINMLFFA